MKTILIFLASIISLNSFAGTSVDVISADFGIEDDTQRKTLCLTVVRVPKTTELLGIVETIEDCFYARAAKKSSDHRLNVDLKALRPVEHAPLRAHLQAFDTQLKFYFSEAE